MARKRMIDPSFWRDEKVAKCSYMERLLFEGLWTFAEDSGVGRASPMLIKADVFPYDTLRESDIEKSLVKLASLEMILLYEISGQKYYYVINFSKHQTINKPSNCYLPVPLPEHYGSTPVVVTSQKEKEKEDKKNRREDIVEYLNEKAGTSYKSSTPKTVDLINARLNEGFGLDDFKRVIDNKTVEWKSDAKMVKFLRPETLFGTKFESYLNQKSGAQYDYGDGGDSL